MAFRPNWYENEGGRSPWRSSLASWSGVRWIITLTVGVFVLQYAEVSLFGTSRITDWGQLRAWLPPSFEDLAAGRPHGAFNLLFPLQLVTYALLHASFLGHLFWNLLFLFFFGPELEASLGRRSFLRLYVGGAIAGGLLQWAWYLQQGSAGAVLGASGAVFAVMVLFAIKWPHRTIMIWFILPVPVWAWVAFEVLANLFGFIGSGKGAAVSFLAHLGGAAFALIWSRSGDVLERAALRRRLAKAGKAAAVVSGDRREMDRILAKIQATGLGSLDKSEREFLDRRSRELRDQGR